RARVASVSPSSGMAMTPVKSSLVAQQLVDTGLGAGLFIDLLDDHGAVEAGPGTAIREWLAGQIARYHHRIGGHLADMDFPRRPVDDLGRRADEDPPRDHRAAADH